MMRSAKARLKRKRTIPVPLSVFHPQGEIVHARVASSFISPEQAELNLKELGDRSFDEIARLVAKCGMKL